MTIKIEIDTSEYEAAAKRFQTELGVDVMARAAGSRLLKWVDDNFRGSGIERKWPPLAESTVAQRRGGSSKPLLDTGALRRSFNMRISGNVVDVGSDSKIAEWQHEGTRPRTISARPGRVLHWKGPGGRDMFARHVRHPGIPARPLIPTAAEAERVVITALEKLVDAVARRSFGD